ncbi:MAG TPA: ABC transporter substrate-binding protein [Solirubrobacteraceae bacterium]|nr:ABC transporter substrate-binding protein [Solirubrobacteraceae bacterium]
MRLRLVLLALLALPLAACGSEEDLPAGAAAWGGAFPVTVEHKFGKTTVEKAPERVVTVGYTDQDAALAVGVVPVAVGDFLGGYDWRARPWAQEALGGAEPKVVAGQQINFEAVAAQRPDLIIAINAGLEQDDYDKLARIAPTVAQSGDYIDFGMPWDEQTMLVARALGREQRGEEVVERVEAKFAQVREEHPEFAGKSGILAYGGPDGYGAYATGDTRSRFFTDLGFELPEQVDELAGESFFTEFSQEQFRLLDQELVAMYGSEDDVLANPVVKRLDAAKQDRMVFIELTDQFAGALGFASALSLDWLLDNEVDAIAAAVDGDPSTEVPQPE